MKTAKQKTPKQQPPPASLTVLYGQLAETIAAIVEHPATPAVCGRSLMDFAAEFQNKFGPSTTPEEDAALIRERFHKALLNVR